MKFLEQISKLFGYSSDTKELSDFLDENNIRERPKYDPSEGSPEAIVSKDDAGYYLLFTTRTGFEKNIAPTVGDSSLGYFVLQEIRLQGPQNMDNVPAFKDELPFGLSFSLTIDEIIGVLGEPDYADDPGESLRAFVWNNFKNFQLTTVLTPDEKNMRHLTIAPARKKFRK